MVHGQFHQVTSDYAFTKLFVTIAEVSFYSSKKILNFDCPIIDLELCRK